jgi:ubiquinone/menaquinone biosynthesis C-methylase UbiE
MNFDALVSSYYDNYYSCVHGGTATGRAASLMQKHLETKRRSLDDYPRVLELGAGTMQHFPFVQHQFKTYIASDIREIPLVEGWERWDNRSQPDIDGNFLAQFDATSIPLNDSSLDRIVATCLLLHLPEPAEALRDWMRVLKPGGVADVLIPCEPGLALRSYRKFVSRPRAQRLGFEYFDLVNAVDHRNYTAAMIQIIKNFDSNVEVQFSWRPFNRIQSWNLNLQMVAHLTKKSK